MMMWIAVIWFFFAIVFLVLGCFQRRMASKLISHFNISQRPKIPGVEIKVSIAGSDIDQPLRDFIAGFNSYIDDYNSISSKEHKTQAVGYWIASATAMLSLVLAVASYV
jgi:hypothetical protein